MTVQHFIDLFQQYGLPMMAAVFFCEYLNLPVFRPVSSCPPSAS